MNGAVVNMVCYERGPFSNVVRYERDLLWTWSVMNVVCYEQVCYERGLFSNVVRYERGVLWTWSVMKVVCYERVCYERGLLWTRSVMNGSVLKGNRENHRKPELEPEPCETRAPEPGHTENKEFRSWNHVHEKISEAGAVSFLRRFRSPEIIYTVVRHMDRIPSKNSTDKLL